MVKGLLLLVASLLTLAMPLASAGEGHASCEFSSSPDVKWPLWKQRSYNYGFDIDSVPVPLVFNAPIMTNSTIMVRGSDSSSKRWGLHCFEAYADDDISRLTMLVNKHVELRKPVAEIYYFGSGYAADSYNWVRIGSDIRGHSFLFDRDRAVFYGSLELDNILTLANISASDLNPMPVKAHAEKEYGKSAAHVKYKALKEAKDGTLYYDRDKKIVVVKIDGKWNRVMVEPLEDYDLCSASECGLSIPAEKPPASESPKALLVRKFSANTRSGTARMPLNGENYAAIAENAPGCLRFGFFQDPSDTSKFLAYGEFADTDSLKRHLSSAYAAAFERQCSSLGVEEKRFILGGNHKKSPSCGLVIAVDFLIPPDKSEHLLKISQNLEESSIRESGVLEYNIWRNVSEPHNLFLFERYKGREAHRSHSKEKHFTEWNSKCSELGYKRKGIFYDVSEL